jgi:hypothetical protein
MARVRIWTDLLLVLAAVVACGALALGLRAVVRSLDPFEASPFEPAAWAAAGAEGRAAMTRDAIRRLPAGLPEAEIERLLGKADEVSETQRLTASRPPGAVRTYSYSLGSWSGQYYDSTFLWVHVDGQGRVIAAVIGGG